MNINKKVSNNEKNIARVLTRDSYPSCLQNVRLQKVVWLVTPAIQPTSAVDGVVKRSTKDSVHDAIPEDRNVQFSSLITALTPPVPLTEHQNGGDGMSVNAKHHARKTYGGVEVELRPLYNARKERCVPVTNKSVRALDLVWTWWSFLQSNCGRSVLKTGKRGRAAGFRGTYGDVLICI
jgi:hypothetical protein